jgi:dehydrogenase/reductase SDR family member 7B
MNQNINKYFNGRIVWVTGASSGIGEALSKQLALAGARLVISSHEPEELERVKKEIGKVEHEPLIISFDLSDPKAVEDAADKVIQKMGGVNIFFCNGGVSTRTTAIDTSLEVDRKVMEINYFSGLIITKKILPGMIDKKFGHIIATSSISGKFGFPLRSAYAASKHALHGFYESLWTELNQHGIRTTIIMPGRVKTNISMHALNKDGKEYGKMSKGQAGGIKPESCARQMLRAAAKNKREVLIGGKELIMPRLKQYFPGIFYKLVTRIDPS